MYAKAFADLAERQFRERWFPLEMVEGWNSFVQEVKIGYDDVPPEYDSDLESARDPLDTFLVDDLLNTFPEHKTFKNLIYQIDKEFKEVTQIHPLLTEDNRMWWINRVPKYAKRDYVDFFNSEKLKEIGLMIKIID